MCLVIVIIELLHYFTTITSVFIFIIMITFIYHHCHYHYHHLSVLDDNMTDVTRVIQKVKAKYI